MRDITDEEIQSMKVAMENDGKIVTWEQATEGVQSLRTLALIMYDTFITDERRKERLKRTPKGFHIDGDAKCPICKNCISNEETWYDEFGVKCLICQKAIDNKVIPPSIIKNDSTWYSDTELAHCFGLKKVSILKSGIEKGIIKARTIYNDQKVHMHVFLIEENKDFLPPKELVKSRATIRRTDKGDWHGSEPWYRFVDPYEHLKGYKIMDYIKVINE
jgi:hypothetical protein